jgi:hypothetical protein
MTVLERIADVLDVPVTELAAEAPIVAAAAETGELPAAAVRLSLLLSGVRIGAALSEDSGTAADLDELRVRTERAWVLTHAGESQWPSRPTTHSWWPPGRSGCPSPSSAPAATRTPNERPEAPPPRSPTAAGTGRKPSRCEAR